MKLAPVLLATLAPCLTTIVHAEPAPKKVISVGKRPESVTRGFGGRYFVTVENEDKPGDGAVKVIEGETVRDFATGLDEPKGICFTGKALVATDLKRVWLIGADGTKAVLADEAAFPQPVSYLNDVACEPGGKAVYVTDMGANTKMRDPQGALWPEESPEAKALPAIGRVYRIDLAGKVTLVQDADPLMPCPNGVTVVGPGRLLIGEFFHGHLLESRGGKLRQIATGYRGTDGVATDAKGAIYVSSWTQGKLWRLGKEGKGETLIAEGFQSAADFFVDPAGKTIALPDMKAGTVTFLKVP